MATRNPDFSTVAPWPGPPLSGLLSPCDRPVIITGAGVSVSCGLPSGSELGEWLREQSFANGVNFSTLDAQDRGTHPGYVASRVVTHDPERRQEMMEAVEQYFADKQAAAPQVLSPLLRAIARTPVGVVLTLNYDTLVEDAARLEGITAHSLGVADIPGLLNNHHLHEPDGQLRVVHLHGVVGDVRSMVLDHTSYMEQANDGRVRELFAAIMSAKHLCALGTQYEEDYLAAIALARRPERPRHVIVCDVGQAENIRNDAGEIGADRHNWLPCAHPAGEYEALTPFCERLVTCAPAANEEGPQVEAIVLGGDAAYASRTLIARDELEEDSQLSPEAQLHWGRLEPHTEATLRSEQLSLVVGAPGSGKSRLLQHLAGEADGSERAVLVRLRDLTSFIGRPEQLFEAWVRQAKVLDGEPLLLEDALGGNKRLWLLLDGLDEAPLAQRAAAADAIERVAMAYPQHRFTAASRPVADVENLSANWRVFDLVCDGAWQESFFDANDIDKAGFRAAMAPGGDRLKSLLETPFFLRGAVDLWQQGVEVTDAMGIALELLRLALESDDQLAALGDAPRRWLSRVAMLQQLTGTVTTTLASLMTLAEEQELGDPLVAADLLAGRSLLAQSDGLWSFDHRLFGEALAAEQLLADDPDGWLDCVAPEADGFSAVVDDWAAPLSLALPRSLTWRRAIAGRDQRFAARSTPLDASQAEREQAAQFLWDRARTLDIWIDPMRSREVELESDGDVVGRLLRAGDLPRVEAAVREGLAAESRMARGNAIDVLSGVPTVDITDILREVLTNDPDSVVRRSAASSARQLELVELVDLIVARAKDFDDDTEATDMASVALYMTPPAERLALGLELVDAGNREVRDYLVLDDIPIADRLTWLERRAGEEGRPYYRLSSDLVELAQDPHAGDEIAARVAYLAARTSNHESAIVEFVREHAHAAAPGLVQALAEDDVYSWEASSLLMAVGADALRAAAASDELIDQVMAWANPPAVERREPRTRVRDQRERLTMGDVLRLPIDELRGQLIDRASLDRATADDLSAEERTSLAEELDRWWADQNLRDAVVTDGQSATIENWAAVMLGFGPAIDLALDDERWAQVATSGFLFTPHYQWLQRHVTQARLDRAATQAVLPRTLTDLLLVAGDLDTARVVQELAAINSDELADSVLSSAGYALAQAGDQDGLVSLASVDARWYAALRSRLAGAGVVEAQLEELRDLATSLRAGQQPERRDIPWTSAITDASTVDAIEDALRATGETRGPTTYPDCTAPLLGALARVQDVSAVAVLDAVIDEPAYPGAQFLVEDRDRVLQAVLRPVARDAARAKAEALELPIDVE